MKCVQVVGQGVPIRVSEDDAQALVNIGDAQYCPRHVWREFYDHSTFWQEKGGRQWAALDRKGAIVAPARAYA